jgi:putative phage-type endonuclease
VTVVALDTRRAMKIGGSEAAAACGVDPHRSRLMLWAEKARGFERPETEPMRWGKLLEPVVYADLERQGFELMPCPDAEWSHPKWPWLVGHPDGFAQVGGARAVLEIKTAGYWSGQDWNEDAGAPLPYLVQAHHYMVLTGCRTTLLACLVGGQRLEVVTVFYDAAVADAMLELELAFIDALRSDTPPPPDGSDSAHDAIRELYPEANGATMRLDRATWEAVKALRERKEQLATVKAQAAELQQTIELAMGDAERAVSPFDTPAARWTNVQSTRLDTAALKAARPDVYQEFAVTKATRRFTLE